jgi:hypothetical protein
VQVQNSQAGVHFSRGELLTVRRLGAGRREVRSRNRYGHGQLGRRERGEVSVLIAKARPRLPRLRPLVKEGPLLILLVRRADGPKVVVSMEGHRLPVHL